MHINLNTVPGAFSPGVVMSPGTFYGRPGEVPTFINAAVGAPLTMRGGGEVTGEGGPAAGVQEQTQGQGQVRLGQRYHQNQTHGAYFYAMSSPKRNTATGMEPKGYFDPLFFPGVNVGGNVGRGGGEGGDSWNVGGSDALVGEIMKDGHAQSLGVVAVEKDEEGRRKGIGRGGEEETHISDDGDDEKDSGDDDDDDDSEPAEEGKNKETYDTDTCPPTSEGHKDGDRRPNKGVGAGALFGSRSESSISRTQSLPLNVSRRQQQQQQHNWRDLGGMEVSTDSDEGIGKARGVQIPTKAGLGSTPVQHGHFGHDEDVATIGLDTLKTPSHVPWKTTTMARATATNIKGSGEGSLL